MSVGHGLKAIHTAMILAQPKWVVVTPDDISDLYWVPVLAWQIDVYEHHGLVGDGSTFANAAPITANSSVDDRLTCALQFGNGAFSNAFGGYDDDAGVLPYFREEEKRLRQAGRK
jgi:hypothetical protein